MWEKQNRLCFYCSLEISLADATFDHVIPLSAGGSSKKKNLVIACSKCNLLKADYKDIEHVKKRFAEIISFFEKIEKIKEKNMKPISENLKDYKLPEKTGKHEHEFQEVCSELAPIFGKQVWILPRKTGFTENRIREAARICKEKGISSFAYLYGVIKKLNIR